MIRVFKFLLPALAIVPFGSNSMAQPGGESSLTYELIINGESFLVEANRVLTLKSQQKPGVSYQVALRLAPIQRLKLNTMQFNYDRLFKVEDDRGLEQRTVRLSHELGFTVLITDLGAPLKPQQQDEALKLLIESVTGTFREMKAAKLEVTKPHTRQFGDASGRGVVVRCRDEQDFGRTCLIYVLAGEKFAGTCIAQYLDNDSDNVLPLVKKTLDSFRAIQ